jgi:hypothetical protein
MTMFTRPFRSLAACSAIAAAVLALPAAAATPATNYSDMWYLSTESGWGVSFVQHSGTNNVYAVWYTYDPRVNATPPDPTSNFVPLWVVLAGGGSWTSPTSYTGPVYVTNGVPFSSSGSNTTVTAVGTFTFNFSDANNGTFTYNIGPPSSGCSDSSCPAFGLPSFTGTKNITRQSF